MHRPNSVTHLLDACLSKKPPQRRNRKLNLQDNHATRRNQWGESRSHESDDNSYVTPSDPPALELLQESSHRVKSWGPQNDPWPLSRDRNRFSRTSTPTNTNLVLSIRGALSPNGQRQKLILKRGSPLIMGKPGAWRPVISCAQPGAN